MSKSRDKALARCYQVLEETGDLDLCSGLYPQVFDEFLEHLAVQKGLSAIDVPPLEAATVELLRRQLLEEARRTRRSGQENNSHPTKQGLFRP